MKILITGSEGLVGKALVDALLELGIQCVPFDFRRSPEQDLRNTEAVASALNGVDGVVHLAALSRVVWAERNPALCQNINECAFTDMVSLCEASRPWLVFASSREVYGQQSQLPVPESAAPNPVNVYGRSKVFGEQLVVRARALGMTANVARLSNVYGSVHDHSDRVIPSFARTAARGGLLRIEGSSSTFDFTHVSDVVRGLLRLIELSSVGQCLDPIHLVTGVGTTLGALARLAADAAREPVQFDEHPARGFDVSSFVGSPARALDLLGWTAVVGLEDGFRDLIADFTDQDVPVYSEFWRGMLDHV